MELIDSVSRVVLLDLGFLATKYDEPLGELATLAQLGSSRRRTSSL